MQNAVYIASLAAAALVALGLAAYVWPRRHLPEALTFLLILGLLVWLSVTELLSLLSGSPGAAAFWFRCRYLTNGFLPVLSLVFSLQYTGRQEWLTRARCVALSIVPVATQLVVWVPPLRRLWGELGFVRSGAILVTSYELSTFGPWFWVHTGYGFLLTIVFSALLVTHAIRSFRVYRRQNLAMLAGIAVMWTATVIFTFNLVPKLPGNPMPIGVALSCLLFAWAMFRYRLLDLRPVARDVVFDTMRDAVFILDAQARLVDFNPAGERLAGLRTSAIGHSIVKGRNDLLQRIVGLCRAGQVSADIELDGPEPQHFEVTVNEARDRGRALLGWVVSLRDITERVRLFRQVEALATIDGLTGVFNRRHFLQRASQEIYRCQRSAAYAIAVVMIDLDHFKAINDTHGHAAGDRVLAEVAAALRGHLRKIDLFGRLGGEEFAILLADVGDHAPRVVERMRAAIESLAIAHEGIALHVTASMGVVSSRQLRPEDLEITRMLDLADQALYRAKQGGRNRVEQATA